MMNAALLTDRYLEDFRRHGHDDYEVGEIAAPYEKLLGLCWRAGEAVQEPPVLLRLGLGQLLRHTRLHMY